MNSVRYFFALITLMALPPSILMWLVVHPFGPFWRRLGPWLSYTILAVFLGLFMMAVFHFRGPLLVTDLGTNYATMALGVVAAVLGVLLGLQRKRHLTPAILSGLPQLSAKRYPGTLLKEGIYRKIRHPRYVEVTSWVLAYALFANFLTVYLLFLLTVPCLLLVVALEERELEERFGDEWREYAARTPRFFRFPSWPGRYT